MNPIDPTWCVVEDQFDPAQYATNETLFALGNGYLGTRGSFVEGLVGYGIEGTYVNGFFDSEPIAYGEKFVGYPNLSQTMLNLSNAKVIRLYLGDFLGSNADAESFDLLTGDILDYRRHLDLRSGILQRHVHWQAPSGRQIGLLTQRLLLHNHPHLMAIRWQATPLNFSGPLTLVSLIDTTVKNLTSSDDPRVGASFVDAPLLLEERVVEDNVTLLRQRTRTTGFVVATGAVSGLQERIERKERIDDGEVFGQAHLVEAREGEPLTLEKFVSYRTSLDVDETPSPQRSLVGSETGEAPSPRAGKGLGDGVSLLDAIRADLEQAQSTGWAALADEQRAYLDDFWQHTDVQIEGQGDEAQTLQLGVRFNLFHLLQSTGRDGRTNIAAKGLTGEGYEGHYFWDTEIYMLPFFTYTNPPIARRLLEFRYNILDDARQRARQMAHPTGALFPWRTISGPECSPYYPGGTAQYHINADVAFALRRYWDATQDVDFMRECGVEMLIETARLWRNVGHFNAAKNGQFCIDCVTGPDEYTALVDNNAYTNLMAQENLWFAAEMSHWLQANQPADFDALAAKVDLRDGEVDAWREAADAMYVPFDVERQIHPQDDQFLNREVWDFAGTPRSHYPLLLHYHPLVLYRHQVCKQADLLLAEFLLSHRFERAQIARDFAYYEPLTTHDSSLSTCIFSILAAELGDVEKAYRYFGDSAIMDLQNTKGNTRDGIHAANMAGTWQSIVFGFAGMRAWQSELSFAPTLPAAWQSYAFQMSYRGRLLHVRVDGTGMAVELVEGEAMAVTIDGKRVQLNR